MTQYSRQSAGPLAGIKVVEMAAIGPVPFCGMMLADMGAEVIRVDRPASANLGIEVDTPFDFMARGKSSIAVNLKQPQGITVVRRILEKADIVIEGFRPLVMERLGLGPEECLTANPRLVFGRCSGWGDKGPLAHRAGHDINFLSIAGVLGALGPKDGPPLPPLNLIGDFGGGAMHLVAGVLAALIAARATGRGQVVSASIADGALGLMPMIYGLRSGGVWTCARGDNVLDGGAPYYRTYRARDGRYVAVGAIETKFYAELLEQLGLQDRVDAKRQNDRTTWPATAAIFEQHFLTRTRDEWADVFADSDACVTPVLELDEAPKHPHHIAARSFVEVEGILQPAPGAKFSQAPTPFLNGAHKPGADTRSILKGAGYEEAIIDQLVQAGAVA